ncbi:MAG: HD domain-containing protein [Clostridia bacterium]
MLLLNNIISRETNQVEGFCIVKMVTVKSNVKGVPYLDMLLFDSGGEINAKLWDYDSTLHGVYEAGAVIKVRCTINIFKDVEQLKIDRIRKAKADDDLDMNSLVPCAPIDPAAAFNEILETVEEFKDEELKILVRYIYNENKDAILSAPAALKLHHAQRGGLLYHTLTMLKLSTYVCDIYPLLDRDLIYAGIILHDTEKIDELTVSKVGIAEAYSVAGQLLGHITMGVNEIGKVCAILDISEEKTLLIQHILLAHHGQPDFGSPRQPMFPEAEVVAELDMLDSRMFIMFDALELIKPGEFTERIWALDNRQLYKHGRTVSSIDN